jgi:hypothetical protein
MQLAAESYCQLPQRNRHHGRTAEAPGATQ